MMVNSWKFSWFIKITRREKDQLNTVMCLGAIVFLMSKAYNFQVLDHGCVKVAHCVPLGDVTSPTTVAQNVSMTCSEHREALTAAPTSD